jgi:uncharacterized protein YndB with AHSA1/START domain
MFRRAVTFPASTESVWHAITDPGAVADWFGARVDWDLRPGGRAHFHPAAPDGAGDGAGGPSEGAGDGPAYGAGAGGGDGGGGGARDGVIEDVEPGRILRFRWWPSDADEDVSEVAYELRPAEEGTILTVTERRLPAPSEPGARPAPVARAEPHASGGPGSWWSDLDQAHWELWAAGTGRTRQIVTVGAAR